MSRYCSNTVIGVIAQATGLALSTVGLLLVAVSATCHAENIVLIRTEHTLSDEQKQIEQIADFYSLKLDSVEVDSPGAAGNAFARLRQRGTLGVLISYDSLAALDRKQVLAALHRPAGREIPILIFGIQATKNPRELRLWSNDEIRDCVPSAKDSRPTALKVENVPSLVRDTCRFATSCRSGSGLYHAIRSHNGSRSGADREAECVERSGSRSHSLREC